MPRPTWTGYLRVSLVSCPISLSPATSGGERIRLHHLNPGTGNRVRQRLVDEESGEELERTDLVWGYEVEKGRYITVTPDELDTIKIESSQLLDLTSFVARGEVDPLYIDAPYFIYPEKDGIDAYRVIAQAMSDLKRVGLGRIVLSTREHPVMVEPFLNGLLMTTLRASGEVRQPEFDFASGKINREMVDMAETILGRLEGQWQPAEFRDEYQDALRELVQSKQRGRPLKKGPAPVEAPSNVVDLMAVLKRSLAASGEKKAAARGRGKRRNQDRRQGNLLLPVEGKKKAHQQKEARPSKTGRRRRSG